MVYDNIEFPVFVVHTNNIELIDGILWVDNQEGKNFRNETNTKSYERSLPFKIYDRR